VSENVRELAACWHDRVHRDRVTEETRKDLDAWLAESEEHRAAYEEVERTWSSLRSLADDPQILGLRHETALRLTRRMSSTVRPLKLAAAAAVLLGVGLALLSAFQPDRATLTELLATLHGHKQSQYATSTGERLAVNLEDGSQITLDTQSALSVSYTKAARWVRLTRGQALFEVAKDRARPFIVDANNRRLVAIGTAFDVRLEGEQVKVTMIEGTVRVERTTARLDPAHLYSSDPLRNDRGGQPRNTITAGEQLIASAGNLDSIRIADAERTTSWRHGQIIFDNTRLADAVAELNRYSQVKLQLADASLADLRLSGAFATGHPQLFLEALTTYFPIQATQSDEHVVLLKARP
jgi:transmembrane sensor